MRQKKRRRILKLRAIRRARELTQAEVARRVGVATPTLCDIENAKKRPSLNTALALQTEFGLPIQDLLSYVEVPV